MMKVLLLLVSIWGTIRETYSLPDTISLMKKTNPQGNKLICTDRDILFHEFLQRTNLYVDKTLLIRTIIDDLKNYSIIITSPRQWGKSLNIQLLSFFWKAELYENGTLVPQELTTAYEFFVHGRLRNDNGESVSFTEPPLISKYPKLILNHLAQYPIMMFNFSTVDITWIENFADTVKAYICSKVYEYYDVMHNLCVNKINVYGQQVHENLTYFIKKFENMQKRCKEDQFEDPFRVEKCLFYASEILSFAYRSKIIVLIDGYDSLLSRMYVRPLATPTTYGQMLWIEDFHWKFIHSIVHNNSCIERVIFTGVLPILFDPGAQLNEMNDMIYYTNTHFKLYQYYGFSRAEVNLLFHWTNISEDLAREAYATYNGYPMEKNATVTTYTPWSIVNLVNTRRVDYYWALDDRLFALAVLQNKKHRHILERLRNYQCVPNDGSEPQPLAAVRRLKTLRYEERTLDEYDWNSHILEELTGRLFYWYFNVIGYFIVLHSNSLSPCSILPNYEIHAVLNHILYGVQMYYKHEPDAARALIEILPPKNNEVEPLIRYFKQILLCNNSEWRMSENYTRIRFFDVLQTASKTYQCNVSMDSPLVLPRNVSFRPSMIMSNNFFNAIAIQTKYDQNDSYIRDTVVHHLWPYSRAYFFKYPKTTSFKVIVVNVLGNRTIQYTNFSFTNISEIPTSEQSARIKKFRIKII